MSMVLQFRKLGHNLLNCRAIERKKAAEEKEAKIKRNKEAIEAELTSINENGKARGIMDGSRFKGIEQKPKLLQNDATKQVAEKEATKQAAEKQNFQQNDNLQNNMAIQHKKQAEKINDIKIRTSKNKRKISKKKLSQNKSKVSFKPIWCQVSGSKRFNKGKVDQANRQQQEQGKKDESSNTGVNLDIENKNDNMDNDSSNDSKECSKSILANRNFEGSEQVVQESSNIQGNMAYEKEGINRGEFANKVTVRIIEDQIQNVQSNQEDNEGFSLVQKTKSISKKMGKKTKDKQNSSNVEGSTN
ncbi:uncharacterized protein [Nicotiana sylvestris]|uniref:uncharacterized protein n=1 Tax=Nicotiana sylvestris TaxID=4096 RepID=UPI00388CD7AA